MENEKTPQEIALEIKSELDNDNITYENMYSICLHIYISKGYDSKTFNEVYKYLQIMLPVLSSNNNNDTTKISSSNVSRIWVGKSTAFNSLGSYDNNTCYLIEED